MAVIFFNREDIKKNYFYLLFTQIGWQMNTVASARDLWLHKDLGTFTGLFTSWVMPQDVGFFIFHRLSHTAVLFSAEEVERQASEAIRLAKEAALHDENVATVLENLML